MRINPTTVTNNRSVWNLFRQTKSPVVVSVGTESVERLNYEFLPGKVWRLRQLLLLTLNATFQIKDPTR